MQVPSSEAYFAQITRKAHELDYALKNGKPIPKDIAEGLFGTFDFSSGETCYRLQS